MTTNPIDSQFRAAFTSAGLNHGLLNREIAKENPDLDSLFKYADKQRAGV